MQDYWCRPSINDLSQGRIDPNVEFFESVIVKKSCADWRTLLEAAVRSQNVDFMIRDQSRPQPPVDSGWVSQPYQPNPLAHAETLIGPEAITVSEYGSGDRYHFHKRQCLGP